MKKTLFLISFLITNLTFAQQYSLFGHFLDFPGYYNPALNKNSPYSEIGVVHRSQWTDFGSPVVSTLFFRFPPNMELPALDFRSVGLMVQHEDYDFLNMTSVQFYTSNTLVKKRAYELAGGLNIGMRWNSLNTSELSAEEISDPKVGQIDGKMGFTNRVGLSFESKGIQIGVSSGINDITDFSDLTVTGRDAFDVKGTKFKIIPGVVYRFGSTTQAQFEVQARAVYDKKVAFTAGYREDFGPLFQLGLVIGKVKGSYGAELPAGNKSAMGMTHEFLLTYSFEIAGKEKKRQDSLLEKRRDSLNALRLEKIRKDRELMFKKEPEADSMLASETDSSSFANRTLENLDNDEPLDFDRVPKHQIQNNMHVIMRHINFETNYDILRPYAFDELDKLVHFLKHSKHFNIEIQGHTDDIGTIEDNDELSSRRALAVYNYLISRGIEANRMKVVGYGELKPLRPNDSDENRALNRRIEVVFSVDD